MIVYLLILLLLIYSLTMTYLYWREKKRRQKERSVNGDVDEKIREIGSRLEEIRAESKKTSIELDDEDW